MAKSICKILQDLVERDLLYQFNQLIDSQIYIRNLQLLRKNICYNKKIAYLIAESMYITQQIWQKEVCYIIAVVKTFFIYSHKFYMIFNWLIYKAKIRICL